jgi:putative FmdB family regulatory protein
VVVGEGETARPTLITRDGRPECFLDELDKSIVGGKGAGKASSSRCTLASSANMLRYAFTCEKCQKLFELTMTISDREKLKVRCPTCKTTRVTAQIAAFMVQTSKKS